MNIHIKGNISLEVSECVHCGLKRSLGTLDDLLACTNCGTAYKLVNKGLKNYKVEAEYKQDGFICMESDWLENCKNVCPVPYSYCEKHSNDAAITKAENEIKEVKDRLDERKEKLERIKESKKLWIIGKLSGINE